MKKRFGRRRKKLSKRELRQREQGFDLSCTSEKLPAYNALFDRNLRHHFENRGKYLFPTQRRLDFYSTQHF